MPEETETREDGLFLFVENLQPENTFSIVLENGETVDVPVDEVWAANLECEGGYVLDGKMIPTENPHKLLLHSGSTLQAVGNLHLSGFVLSD